MHNILEFKSDALISLANLTKNEKPHIIANSFNYYLVIWNSAVCINLPANYVTVLTKIPSLATVCKCRLTAF